MLPFGISEGDSAVPRFLDGSSSRIDLCTPFPFFETTEISLYVSSIHDSVGRVHTLIESSVTTV